MRFERQVLLGAAFGVLCAGGAIACPNPAFTGATAYFTGGQLATPQTLASTATGGAQLSACGIPGTRGYAAPQPNFTLYLNQMQGYGLNFDVDSDCDTTLLIRAADGTWHFDDDGGEGLTPEMDLSAPQHLEGRVDVWIGTYSNTSCPATLALQTTPSAPQPLPPQPPQVAGCPNPAYGGQAVSYNANQLFTSQSLGVLAAGSTPLSSCPGIDGRGYVNAAPDYSFYLSGMDPYGLELDVDAACDATMLVRTADGMWHFDDDSDGNLDPRLTLQRPTVLNGRMDVWVGTYGGNSCNATLNMRAGPTELPPPPPPPPPPQAGCPNPSLNGQMLGYTASQLAGGQSLGVMAAGSTRVAGCGIPGGGYANAQPDVTLNLSQMQGSTLTLAVDASCDSTMLIHAADGSWHYNDDGNGNLDPRITLSEPGELNGQLDLWIGTYGGNSCNATLTLQTSGSGGGGIVPPPSAGLSGTWQWEATGGTVTINANGTVTDNMYPNTGTWSGPGSDGRYTIVWSHGYTDFITMSADGNALTIINNTGYAFGATRISSGTGGGGGGGLMGRINVLSASYGVNCGAPQGNVTGHIAAQCNGQTSCDYRVDHTVIGDPAVGCRKTYQVSYECGDGVTRTAEAPAEASGRSVALQCAGGSSGGNTAALEGTWNINANGHRGTITFQHMGGGTWTGTLTLGSSEPITDVVFNAASGRVLFERPNVPQYYTGVVTGGEISGSFESFGTTYTWTATR
ncbi:hypothetical protein [Roseicyclus elongatus]|nr:hypothetical protein [Roseibacterium elongatum]